MAVATRDVYIKCLCNVQSVPLRAQAAKGPSGGIPDKIQRIICRYGKECMAAGAVLLAMLLLAGHIGGMTTVAQEEAKTAVAVLSPNDQTLTIYLCGTEEMAPQGINKPIWLSISGLGGDSLPGPLTYINNGTISSDHNNSVDGLHYWEVTSMVPSGTLTVVVKLPDYYSVEDVANTIEVALNGIDNTEDNEWTAVVKTAESLTVSIPDQFLLPGESLTINLLDYFPATFPASTFAAQIQLDKDVRITRTIDGSVLTLDAKFESKGVTTLSGLGMARVTVWADDGSCGSITTTDFAVEVVDVIPTSTPTPTATLKPTATPTPRPSSRSRPEREIICPATPTPTPTPPET